MTADEAIAQSQQQNEIVTISWSEELATDLLCESDDSADNGPVVEFWGENDDGTWRVHLERASED